MNDSNKNAYDASKNQAENKRNNMDNARNNITGRVSPGSMNRGVVPSSLNNRNSSFNNTDDSGTGNIEEDESSNSENQDVEQNYNTSNNESISKAVVSGKKAVDTFKKFKLLLPLLPTIGIVLIVFVILITLFMLVPTLINIAGDKFANFFTGNGFESSANIITGKIDAAADYYNGLKDKDGAFDEGILLAAANDSAVIDYSVYSSETINDNGSNYENNDFDKTEVSSSELNSYYRFKANMLGSIEDNPSMVYSLIDYKITWSCSNDKPNLLNYSSQIAIYISHIVYRQMDSNQYTAFKLGDVSNYVVEIIDSINSGTNYADYNIDKLREVFTDNSVYEIVKNALDGLFEDGGITKCSGSTPYLTPNYTAFMDYDGFFHYIKNVYTPIMYYERKDGDKVNTRNYTDDEKTRIFRTVVNNIVDLRNSYYSAQGINNIMLVNYDKDGNVIVTVTGDKLTDDGTSSGGTVDYSSSIPVGTAGTSWKQFGESWSNINLGNSAGSSMKKVGCYITSISILMANSGTKINSATFDPGVLARVIKENNGFTDGGSLSYNDYANPPWKSLAPNFIEVANETVSGLNKDTIAGKIAAYLNKGYYVSIQVKGGGHFVAVVGIQDGRIVIADPGVSATPMYFDSTHYAQGTIKSLRVFKAS